jgi:hypothetical protein
MARQAVLELVADASKLRSTLKTAEGDTDRFGSKMGALGGVIAGALTGAALISFGKSAVTAFTESEQAQSKLNVALGNSPATVGVTAAAFEKYNSVLAKKTLVDDDALASGQAVLAGFGLTEDQLKQMTPVLADYAARTGKDIPSAAEDLGKAILGQGRALKGIGVEFDDTGTAGGNFAQIMDQVGGKVKGAAQAQLDAAGPGASMKKSMDELQESVGVILVPALQALAGIISTVIDFFTNLSAPIKIAIGVVAALAAGVYLIVTAQKAWVAIQTALNVVMALNPIGLVVAAVVALVAILVVAYKNSETFRDIVNGAFNAVKDVVMGVFNWVKDNWPLLLGILTGPVGLAVLAITKNWDTIKDTFTGVKNWIGDRVGDIVGFFTGLPGRITSAASGMWDGIKNAFQAAVNWIIRKWNDLRLTIGGNTFDLPGPLGSITIPSMSLDTPNLPYLHSGGVVPGVPGSDVLAMLQAGERVIPRGGGGGGGGGTVNYYQIAVTAIDPASASEAVVAAIREYERRNGTNWRAS